MIFLIGGIFSLAASFYFLFAGGTDFHIMLMIQFSLIFLVLYKLDKNYK